MEYRLLTGHIKFQKGIDMETWNGLVGATSRKKLCPYCNRNEIWLNEWICKNCENEKRYLMVSE
jgi:hypothetical protein